MKQQKLTREMLDLLVCDRCGTQTYHVYVHGHYQCNDCKVVTDPCCSGEQNNSKKDYPALSQKQKEQWLGYVSSKIKVNDQENIKRVKERVDRWTEETQDAEEAAQ